MPTYQIHVADQCSEHWNQMRSKPNGKFCFNCKKDVVDFTNMNEKDIVEYLLKHKNTCGRFYRNQLDKPIEHVPIKSTRLHWPAITAMLVAGIFSIAPAFSQTENQKKLHPRGQIRTEPKSMEISKEMEIFNADSLLNEESEPSNIDFTKVTGIIINKEDSTPVEYAVVTLEIDSVEVMACLADSFGAFSMAHIRFETHTKVVLSVKAAGYYPHFIRLKEEDVTTPLNIALSEREIFMGISTITIHKTIEPITEPGHYFFNAPGFN